MDSCLIGAFSWLSPSSWWAILQMVIGLGFVIFVHELGHFLVAKACGVKCEKFYVGFDAFDIKFGDRVIIPRSLVKWQWGETEYGVGVVPLGGYVKMLGQDDNPNNIEKEIARSTIESEYGDEPEVLGLADRDKMDPRSFLAKSVPQRMAIISAGVIFNLIFAVLMAAVAFKSGVNYEPPVVGSVVSGGPAWQADMTGSAITKLNGTSTGVVFDEYGKLSPDGASYFTYMDMAQEVIFSGSEKPLEIEIQRPGESKPSVINVTPVVAMNRGMEDAPLIGVGSALYPKLGANPALEGNPTVNADPPFMEGDLVRGIAGEKVETIFDVKRLLASNHHLEVEFELERADGTTVKTTVGPNPYRDLGFSLAWNPVVAVQSGSPAETAGIKAGDEIIEVNHQPRGELSKLDGRITRLAHAGEDVVLTIKRGDQELPITVKPRMARTNSIIGPFDMPVGVDSLGLAIGQSRIVESVTAGGGAESAGLKVGDELLTSKFVLTDEQSKKDMYEGLNVSEIDLVKTRTGWAEIAESLQALPAGQQVELVVLRDKTKETITLTSSLASDDYSFNRGIRLSSLQHHYVSNSWGDAVKLGFWRTVDDANRVWKFLKKLVTGKLSVKNLGGPGTIAMVATSEASQGTSRLLLFLTLLSANLAIVNFLPIPILDGGHMLFLAYEGIFRRPVSERAQTILSFAGLIFILGLMLFVICMDVTRMGFF